MRPFFSFMISVFLAMRRCRSKVEEEEARAPVAAPPDHLPSASSPSDRAVSKSLLSSGSSAALSAASSSSHWLKVGVGSEVPATVYIELLEFIMESYLQLFLDTPALMALVEDRGSSRSSCFLSWFILSSQLYGVLFLFRLLFLSPFVSLAAAFSSCSLAWSWLLFPTLFSLCVCLLLHLSQVSFLSLCLVLFCVRLRHSLFIYYVIP